MKRLKLAFIIISIVISYYNCYSQVLLNNQFIFKLGIRTDDDSDNNYVRRTVRYTNYDSEIDSPAPNTPFYCAALYFYTKDSVAYVSFNNSRFNDDGNILQPTTCVCTQVDIRSNSEKHIKKGTYLSQDNKVYITLNDSYEKMKLTFKFIESPKSLILTDIEYNNTTYQTNEYFGIEPKFLESSEGYLYKE